MLEGEGCRSFAGNFQHPYHGFIMRTIPIRMSTAEIRQELHRLIDQIDDRMLKAVFAMVRTYEAEEDPIIGYDTDGKAVRASEAREQLLAEVAAAKRGEYTTLEDFKKEVEN